MTDESDPPDNVTQLERHRLRKTLKGVMNETMEELQAAERVERRGMEHRIVNAMQVTGCTEDQAVLVMFFEEIIQLRIRVRELELKVSNIQTPIPPELKE